MAAYDDYLNEFGNYGGRGAAGIFTLGASETDWGKQNPVIGGMSDFANTVFTGGGLIGGSGKKDAAAAQAEYQRQVAAERARRRDAQLGILGTMQAPQMSPQAARRIAALESESQPRALAEDPLYAGQRAAIVSGGQQIQSGIENEQLGRGVRGGFANVGSVHDIQDRLGVSLAQLGSQAQATREKKRDMAAAATQEFQDAQTDFANAQQRARMAIESGDSELALSMINQAFQAKNAVLAAEQKQKAAMIGMVGTIGGAMIGGPAGAMAGNQVGNAVAGGGAATGPSLGAQTNFGAPQQFEGFNVGDTGAGYSNMTYANARRQGLY